MCIAERHIDLSEVDGASLSYAAQSFTICPVQRANVCADSPLWWPPLPSFLRELAVLDEYVDIKELFLYRSVLAVLHVLFLSV